MNRRKFIGNTALFSVPLMIKGIPVFAGESAMHPFLQSLTSSASNCGKILVVIQLNGGNDGLNMVIPLDKYSELSAARPGLMIPANQVLALNGTSITGLHPSMTGMRDLFNQGKMTIVQGVSYPNPNFSHFQAQDIWFSGTASAPMADTGWLGRQLDADNPGFPAGYPNTDNLDPLAIQIGGALPLSLQGPNINMGYNAPNPAALVSVATGIPAPAPANDYGTELTFLRLMKDQSNAYTTRITNAFASQGTLSGQYATSGNTLSDQLKIVARLIGGGLTTPVYIVNHPDSFDTHVNQAVPGDPTSGAHANSLSKLSVAISAFQEDITLMNKADKVSGMTFSEFGRRVIANTSNGTDHGSGAPVIFFGAGVNPGILGTSPVLPPNPTGSTQVPLQYDFRQLYASVMQQWLCMTGSQSQTVLFGNYNTLDIFNAVVLPLDGLNLVARWENEKAFLEFTVYENDSYARFEIERSIDGVNFSAQHTINNASNNTQQRYEYREDRIRAKEVYYRVKGFAKRGDVSISPVVILRNGGVQMVRIYPNPVINHTINIEFIAKVTKPVIITIYGTLGEKLYYNQVNPMGSSNIRFKVANTFVANTIYVLNVAVDDQVTNEKIMFQ